MNAINTEKKSANQSRYEEIADTIIASMEKGFIPWQKPWNGVESMPKNLVSNKAYRGMNVWLLAMTSFTSPFWMSFKQAKALGGSVKKGEHGTRVYFWSSCGTKTEKGEIETPEAKTFVRLFVRSFTVFNLEQCEGVKIPAGRIVAKVEKTEIEKLEICESIIAGYKNAPKIEFGGNKAFYRPSEDLVNVPVINDFSCSEGFYGTMFHELAHSTGSKNRLNRDGITDSIKFGSHSYGREELIAEFAASFLCGVAGIGEKVFDNSVAYLQNWKSAIKADPAMLMTCASKAQKAVELIYPMPIESEDSED